MANALTSPPTCAVPTRGSILRQRPSRLAVSCSAAQPRAEAGRRAVLLGLSSTAASTYTAKSDAAVGVWDGKKGTGQCDLGVEGDACRMESIEKDAAKGKEDYSKIANKEFETVVGTPVSEMGDVYITETVAMRDLLSEYVQLEPYDKRRPQMFKDVKKTGSDWVSKYARGGNVRKQSARTFYVAVDALQGHIAQNGLAPMPRMKAEKVLDDLSKGTEFMLAGK